MRGCRCAAQIINKHQIILSFQFFFCIVHHFYIMRFRCVTFLWGSKVRKYNFRNTKISNDKREEEASYPPHESCRSVFVKENGPVYLT